MSSVRLQWARGRVALRCRTPFVTRRLGRQRYSIQFECLLAIILFDNGIKLTVVFTPSTHWQSNLFLKLKCFFPGYVKTHKVSTFIRGGFMFFYTNYVMKRFIPHVHRAQPLNGFEKGSNLAENRIEFC